MGSPTCQLWKCRDREFRLEQRALIMGIVNVTPDSFSDGGRYNHFEMAIQHACRLIEDGADIIDVGGESTRPGAEIVPVDEELRRVVPVVEFLVKNTKATLSVDTTKAEVAEAALAAGAHIINDVTGLSGDPGINEAVRRFQAGVVVMHMQGAPENMQENPSYHDAVSEISAFLSQQVASAISFGIASEQMVVDPGIGFGKTLEHNVALLRHLDRISRETSRPVLVGVSRKRFIGTITGRVVEDRLAGSLAAMAFAIQRGARIIRVHDVKESCDVAHMMATLESTEDD